eukprot:20916-Heterococcus_DN1.PRE.1
MAHSIIASASYSDNQSMYMHIHTSVTGNHECSHSAAVCCVRISPLGQQCVHRSCVPCVRPLQQLHQQSDTKGAAAGCCRRLLRRQQWKSLPVFAAALLLAAVAPLLRINPTACANCCVGTAATAACLQAAVATLGSAPHESRTPFVREQSIGVCIGRYTSVKPDPAASHSLLPDTVQHPVGLVHIQLVQLAHLLVAAAKLTSFAFILQGDPVARSGSIGGSSSAGDFNPSEQQQQQSSSSSSSSSSV